MNRILQLGLLAAMLLGAGCSTTNIALSNAELVGGGIWITWKAPSDGTAILVEQSTRTMIRTDSLSEGELYEFDAGMEGTQYLLKVALPPTQTNANFVLYFRPLPKSP